MSVVYTKKNGENIPLTQQKNDDISASTLFMRKSKLEALMHTSDIKFDNLYMVYQGVELKLWPRPTE